MLCLPCTAESALIKKQEGITHFKNILGKRDQRRRKMKGKIIVRFPNTSIISQIFWERVKMPSDMNLPCKT